MKKVETMSYAEPFSMEEWFVKSTSDAVSSVQVQDYTQMVQESFSATGQIVEAGGMIQAFLYSDQVSAAADFTRHLLEYILPI